MYCNRSILTAEWRALAQVRRGEIGPLEAVLMWMQASSARMLSVLPGEEFRTALRESRKCGASFVLGDRPCQVKQNGDPFLPKE